jgi:phosphonatase-like hydrolase
MAGAADTTKDRMLTRPDGRVVGFAEPLLARLGWRAGGDLVDALVCVDDVPAGRPAPYLVFRAMERTGVQAMARVLVAGDTLADLRSGTNAGAGAVVGVATGALSLADLGAERHAHLLPSAAYLPALVAGLDGE